LCVFMADEVMFYPKTLGGSWQPYIDN
jgi:hypothetical protein